ncbi:MAG: hypothetical protein IJ702_09210, partial [Fretibacterium sp.]|nr:hypothetical protein [Fretibacterium sp.]
MIGPDLTGVNRVLSRIEQIVRQSMPETPPMQPIASRFVDVLDEAGGKNGGKASLPRKGGQTSYAELQDVIDR